MSRPQAPRNAASARWLTGAETAAWIETALVVTRLPALLDAQLQRDAGLTFYEYLVLSGLSMSPDRTRRMSELAAATSASLSRLSHVVSRLEERGLVQRSKCPGGLGRATNATLTCAGYDAVLAAAPGHVQAVRELLIDPLTPEQVATLTAIGRRLRPRLDPAGTFDRSDGENGLPDAGD